MGRKFNPEMFKNKKVSNYFRPILELNIRSISVKGKTNNPQHLQSKILRIETAWRAETKSVGNYLTKAVLLQGKCPFVV